MNLFVPVCGKKLYIVAAFLLVAGFLNRTHAQANDCAGVVTPLTINTNSCAVTTAGTTVGATQSMPACAGGTTADDDVWFSFVQNGGALTITVTGGGPAGQLKNPVFEVFSGTCGSLTSVFCDNSAVNNTEAGTLPNNLVNGATYYVRVYSATNVAADRGTFTICVSRPNPPGNDNATTATALTPGTLSSTATCPGGASSTTGNLVNATNSNVTGSCGGSADDDVWYSFVAGNASQVITLSGIGTSIAVAGAGIGGSAVMEVFSSSTNTAAGVFTSVGCGQVTGTNLVISQGNFIPGNTYFVRVYSTNSISLNNNAGFTICITNPPASDVCSGAIALTPAANCTNGSSRMDGTLVGASNSGIAAGCGGTADDDVWFSFVAQFVTQNITIDNIGTNIAVNGSGLGGSVMLEVFASSTNNCAGAFTSIACGYASGNNLIAFANSLIVGNTYYIRVYSTNNVRLIGNANFRVCVQNPNLAPPPNLYFGKSFINITKGSGGGTVEPGDVLEIRAAITLRGTGTLDSCGFFDNVPAGTTFVPGSMAVLTNEGKVYKSFTDAGGDDAGTVSGSAIRINLGFATYDGPATPYRRGRLKNSHIPTVGGTCLMLVSYRVTVTAPLNSIINLGGGQFTYSLLSDITNVITNNFNQNNVIVYTNTGLCANSTGVNVLDAGLAGDFNGTFGNGNTINRVASLNMPPGHTYVTQTGGAPGDFNYTITNNMSNNAAGYSTTDAWPKPESPQVHRIFGVWDVIGDHTGAADPLAGNPAADTTNGGTGGYMLLVNSAYTLDTVFRYPISGLCPNTYYEISFWVRNVCSRCGIDSLARGASGITVPAGYIPTDVGDSSGVYPNLSFSIDGVNHYTTGNMRYTGQWVQKGFVFRTGAAQTDIVFAIANNAPGGGGNDWALDDISLSTCTPDLNLVPSGNSQVCYANQVNVNCDIVSFFDNYSYYQWQVSHDNGATWTDTLSMGTGTPTLSGGSYSYNAPFPAFLADSSQHLVQYRIRVATTPSNLFGGCSFFNSLNIVVMVNNCTEVLSTNLLSFDAILKNRHAVLTWKTTDELAQTLYEVQRSLDGVHFVTIGTINAYHQLTNNYTFTDPDELRSYAYYRIVIQEPQGRKNSRVRQLNVTDIPFDVLSVVNPFNNKLTFDLSMPQTDKATILLSDQHGKTIKVIRRIMQKGMSQVEIDNLGSLPGGTYILQVITDSGTKAKRVVKLSN